MGYILKETAVSRFCTLNQDMHVDRGPHMDILHGFSEEKVQSILNGIKEVDEIPEKTAVLATEGLGLKKCSHCGRIYSVSKLFAAAGGSSPKFCLNCGARFIKPQKA